MSMGHKTWPLPAEFNPLGSKVSARRRGPGPGTVPSSIVIVVAAQSAAFQYIIARDLPVIL